MSLVCVSLFSLFHCFTSHLDLVIFAGVLTIKLTSGYLPPDGSSLVVMNYERQEGKFDRVVVEHDNSCYDIQGNPNYEQHSLVVLFDVGLSCVDVSSLITPFICCLMNFV